MAEHAPNSPGDAHAHTDATLVPASRADGSPGNGAHDETQLRHTHASPPGFPRPGFAASLEETGVEGYELLGELGRGGMGVVYKARQRALNRPVALKMVLAGAYARDSDIARFRAEAEVVAHLQHPHIIQIYQIGEIAGRPYLALELVTGGTLQKAIAGTPQPIRATAHMVELLARAIHFAHQRGVIHRDLKPGNVLLAVPLDGGSGASDRDGAEVAALYGVPKVTDFGLAKRLEDDAQHTQSGDIIGTPSYMAPEQAGGKAFAAGPATDVYALGAILYDMLTGRPPFKGATTFETIQQVLNEDPVPPGRLRPRLPKDLERICLKCLQKDPRRRYASALDLAADLRRHLNGESVHARAASPPERLWRWSRRNPVPASLLLAITFGAAFGFWHLSDLSQSLVRSTALEGAAQQTETLDEVNRYYTRIASHLRKAGAKDEFAWESHHKQLTMPPPATATIELGQQITARSQTGVQVRLYSDMPFTHRLDRPPPDEFEREALAALRGDPSKPYYRFEELGGRPVLRFASARVMEGACVECHNSHPNRNPQSPVWKVGDVRGVLEIIRPIDRDQGRISQGLRSTVVIVTGSGVTLLILSAFLIYLGNRRPRALHAASSAPSHDPASARAAPPGGGPGPVSGADGPATEQSPGESVPIEPPRTAADSVPTVPDLLVAWRTARAIGTLTPMRLVVSNDGTLRLSLGGSEFPAELRVEVQGVPVAAEWAVAPHADVAVRAGDVVVARVRAPETPDASFTLTAELLVAGRG